MKTLTITAADLKDGKYAGTESLDGFEGNLEIEADLGYVHFEDNLSVTGYIYAKAGSGIKAGWGIEAGWGILSGLAITCKRVLSFRLRLFAGTCTWRAITDDERTITCENLVGGEVCYGIVNEVGTDPASDAIADRIAQVESELATLREQQAAAA